MKQNLEMLKQTFGELYSFSDNYILMIMNQTAENIKKNCINVENSKISGFNKSFSNFFYTYILNNMRDDHKNLFSFYMGVHFE